MDVKSLFPVCVLVLLCLQMHLYSSITIEIKPETFDKSEGSTVEVTCKLDGSERDASQIMLMNIARKGERAIVLLHRNNSLMYAAGNRLEFPATGQVNAKDVTKTVLKMTITTPDPEDSGAYTCNVFYITSQGTLKEHKAGGYLTVQDPAILLLNMTLKELADKVEEGQTEIVNLKWKDTTDKLKLADLDSKINQHTDDIKKLQDQDKDVDDKLKKMEDKTKNQIKKIADDVNNKTADKTKVANLESTVLHQAETIKDLTEKLSEFEKKMQDMRGKLQNKKDKEAGGSPDDTKDQVRTLKQTVELLTKTVNDITDKVDRNEDSTTKLTSTASVMARKIDANLNKVTDVENNLKKLEDDTKKKLKQLSNDDLDNDFLNLQDKVKEHTKQIRDVTDKATETGATLNKLKAATEVLVKQVNGDGKSNSGKTKVAFHVTAGVYGILPKENEPLIFPEVTLNEGNGYDKRSGTFTAPQSGIYAFHLYLQVPCYGCRIEVVIQADTRILARYTGGDSYTLDQHAVSAVVKLQATSKVKALVTFIRIPNEHPKWTLGYMQKCGFSGFLISTR